MSDRKVQTTAVRRPYRIVRGQYSRREGTPVHHIDPDTGKPTRRKSRPFVHYMARTKDNPNAKDEIDLTDTEARAFGLGRLKRLFAHDVRTPEEDSESGDIAKMDTDGKSRAEVVASLIRIGEGVSGNRAVNEWKKQVLEAGVLDVSMPKARDEVLDVLRQIESQIMDQVQTQ